MYQDNFRVDSMIFQPFHLLIFAESLDSLEHEQSGRIGMHQLELCRFMKLFHVSSEKFPEQCACSHEGKVYYYLMPCYWAFSST